MGPSKDSFVSIACEGGGPETIRICKLKVPLYQALRRHVSSTHCAAVDSYDVVLRVDGSLAKYGAEGLARLRFARARRYITVDVQIPEAAWHDKTDAELRSYLSKQVEGAVTACVGRLRKDKHDVAIDSLMAEVRLATHEYRCSG